MRKIIGVVLLLSILAVAGLAQDKPESAPAQPKLLSAEQLTQLASLGKDLQLAQSQFQAARLNLEKTQGLQRELTFQFFLQLELDLKSYEPELQVIDQKTGKIGFLPKTEPAKPDAKPPDVAKPEQEKK